MQTMQNRQRGLGLIQVAVLMAALAGVAMVAMMSMRNERNYFADAIGKLTGQAAPAADAGADAGAVAAEPKQAPAAPAGVLRKCTINGKLVLSDTDCGSAGTVVKPLATQGVVAPKAPQPEPEQQASTSMQDKMIEKATR